MAVQNERFGQPQTLNMDIDPGTAARINNISGGSFIGIKTQYKGYKAYSYLEAGSDYPAYEFTAWNWMGEYLVPLSAEQEKKAEAFARDHIVIILHEHMSDER